MVSRTFTTYWHFHADCDLYLFMYSSKLVELLIVQHANRLCVSTTQFSTSIQGPVPKRKLIFKLHSQTVNSGNTDKLTYRESSDDGLLLSKCSYWDSQVVWSRETLSSSSASLVKLNWATKCFGYCICDAK